MPLRNLFFAGLVGAAAFAPGAALAGGGDCVACYRHVVRPPVYRAVSERVLVRPERTIAHWVPAQYATVPEKVLVSPSRKVWQVTRGPHGEAVGCWVVTPAQYALRHRSVLVRPETVVPQTVPAVYGTRSRSVLVEPGRSGWEPIAGRPAFVGAAHHFGLGDGHRFHHGHNFHHGHHRRHLHHATSPAYGPGGIYGAAGFAD